MKAGVNEEDEGAVDGDSGGTTDGVMASEVSDADVGPDDGGVGVAGNAEGVDRVAAWVIITW